jgi:putative sterol carrier protein
MAYFIRWEDMQKEHSSPPDLSWFDRMCNDIEQKEKEQIAKRLSKENQKIMNLSDKDLKDIEGIEGI